MWLICIDPKAFVNLYALLRDCGGLQPIQRATIEEQVAKFLYIIGHDIKNCPINFFFWRSDVTISYHFHSVIVAIIKLEKKFLK